MDNRFNLIEQPWIPIADVGRASLRQIFTQPEYRSLGGNPIQKIATTKLLLAIAQAAATPQDRPAWEELGAAGLAARCLEYLEEWHERFYLYGEKPFLQMPAIAQAKVQSYGALLPEISTGNTTVLSQIQIQRPLEDADKALLLVVIMGFALGGKKVDNSVALTPKLKKKAGAQSGPAMAYMGLLHSHFMGATLQESIWINVLTAEQIEESRMFPQGVGKAVWEQMPAGEGCPVAEALKHSLQGRLVPLCRFCLLTDEGMHYSEGIQHPGYKEGVADPTVAVNRAGEKTKVLWANPEKRPWRELTSLLAFIDQDKSSGFESLQLSAGMDRIRDATDAFGIWSGGLRVSSNAGEQYVSGHDDFVESLVRLHSDFLKEGAWFAHLKSEMGDLDGLAKVLYGGVICFYKEHSVDPKTNGTKLAGQATNSFWQLCERRFQELIDACGTGEQSQHQRRLLRYYFAGCVRQVYDRFCPRESARQLEAWAKHRPNNSKYLKHEGHKNGSDR